MRPRIRIVGRRMLAPAAQLRSILYAVTVSLVNSQGTAAAAGVQVSSWTRHRRSVPFVGPFAVGRPGIHDSPSRRGRRRSPGLNGLRVEPCRRRTDSQ